MKSRSSEFSVAPTVGTTVTPTRTTELEAETAGGLSQNAKVRRSVSEGATNLDYRPYLVKFNGSPAGHSLTAAFRRTWSDRARNQVTILMLRDYTGLRCNTARASRTEKRDQFPTAKSHIGVAGAADRGVRGDLGSDQWQDRRYRLERQWIRSSAGRSWSELLPALT